MGQINPECQVCDLHKTCRTVCIAGDGPRPCDIVFVGEAPGAEEDQAGLPFVGRSGKLIRGVAEKELEVAYRFENVVRCRPPKNRPPKPVYERKRCVKAYFWTEIKQAEPKLIVCLGASAAAGVLGLKQLAVGENRRKVFHLGHDHTGGLWKGPMVVTFHPSAVLRNRNLFTYWVEDIRWAVQECLVDG